MAAKAEQSSRAVNFFMVVLCLQSVDVSCFLYLRLRISDVNAGGVAFSKRNGVILARWLIFSCTPRSDINCRALPALTVDCFVDLIIHYFHRLKYVMFQTDIRDIAETVRRQVGARCRSILQSN